jgi:NAD(P)-dependent dehydrogenase (short-subunit alcohol dehydrogenase family)
MHDGLQDRVILIAGATGALGTAVVREFAGSGARLALTGTSTARLQELAARVSLEPDRHMLHAADVTQPQEVDGLVQAVLNRFGRLEILLNTVGGWSGGKSIVETTVDQWDRMLNLNLRSAFLLSRAVLTPILDNKWGRIVHVSSRSAIQPRANQVGYVVSKMGVIALTEALAAEVKGTGVTVNAILLSTIDTAANRASMPKANPDKWVSPADVATVMRFLCSDAGASIHGAQVPVYGVA